MFAGWAGAVAMLPLIRRATRALRPPRLPWPAVPLAHLPAAMLFAGGQVAIMAALLKLTGTGLVQGLLTREVRTDVVIYAIGAGLTLWRGR